MAKGNFKLFIVDDDTKHLLLLKEYLESKSSYNLVIRIFASGENCLKKLDEGPDIIILDYFLDGINQQAKNGLAILEAIRKFDQEVKVVIMSQQDDIQIALKTLEAGANDYIVKNESAYLRARLVVDHIIESINADQWIHRQKRRQAVLSGVIAVLIFTLAGLAVKLLSM